MTDIPSVKKYKHAFTQLRGKMTEYQYEMLLVHYRSPRHAISPRRMAEAMKWNCLGSANCHYGNFAGGLRQLLKREPKYRVELLCSFDWDDDDDEIVWVMHDNVATALEELDWVKSHPRILAARGLYRARKKELDRVRAYIAGSSWRFSRAMPQWPHCYVLREWGRKRDFDLFAKLIEENGYIDQWGQNRRKYLVVDNLKYWIDDDVLNRAKPKLNEWFREYGKKYIAKYGRRVVGQPRC
jgi:hypothetical protein